MDVKHEMKNSVKQLKTLRDEIKVYAHLANLELKQRWEELEPKLAEAERYVDEVSEVSRKAAQDLVRRARELRDGLKELQGEHKVMRH